MERTRRRAESPEAGWPAPSRKRLLQTTQEPLGAKSSSKTMSSPGVWAASLEWGLRGRRHAWQCHPSKDSEIGVRGTRGRHGPRSPATAGCF